MGAYSLLARRYAERGYLCPELSTHGEGSVTICSAFLGPATVARLPSVSTAPGAWPLTRCFLSSWRRCEAVV